MNRSVRWSRIDLYDRRLVINWLGVNHVASSFAEVVLTTHTATTAYDENYNDNDDHGASNRNASDSTRTQNCRRVFAC